MATNKQKFNKKYKQPLNQPNSKTTIVKLTGIPKRILDQVWDRSGGARGMARVYSFVMKQPGTWGRADKDLADKVKKMKLKGYSR